jgi:hypothetical protein
MNVPIVQLRCLKAASTAKPYLNGQHVRIGAKNFTKQLEVQLDKDYVNLAALQGILFVSIALILKTK